jgi:hypothetical protein
VGTKGQIAPFAAEPFSERDLVVKVATPAVDAPGVLFRLAKRHGRDYGGEGAFLEGQVRHRWERSGSRRTCVTQNASRDLTGDVITFIRQSSVHEHELDADGQLCWRPVGGAVLNASGVKDSHISEVTRFQ